MAMLLDLIYKQWCYYLPYPRQDFSGQTIIVTGANVGLGLEAARHFVRLKAEKVILGVRNLEKGEAAKKSIQESTNRTNVVEVWQLDLTSYDSTKQFAKRAETSLKRIDALVENAGIAKRVYRVAEDNEATITTNVVSTFLLALMMLPKLRETASRFNTTPRLVVVSSEVHFYTTFPERKAENIFKTLNDKETANMGDRYQVSKLLEVFYCRELAARTKARDVTINFLTPGLCHSGLARDAGSLSFISFLKFFVARSTEHGSRSLVSAAAGGTETHGQFLDQCKVAPPAPLVLSAEGAVAQRRVWDELSQKLEVIQPGIMANV